MTTPQQAPDFHTASALRSGARVAVVAVLCAALAGGFVAGLQQAPRQAGRQVASTPPTCASLPC
jgi:heme A synthase